jgi:hypothetical protein
MMICVRFKRSSSSLLQDTTQTICLRLQSTRLMGYSKITVTCQSGENKIMKLYEALAMKKSLQTQLVQLIGLRNRNLEYPEDEKPEFDFDSLTAKIKEIVIKLTKIKVAIAKENLIPLYQTRRHSLRTLSSSLILGPLWIS